MWRIKESVEIQQPVATVFHYLSHFHYVREWDTTILNAEMVSTGEPAVGSRFRLTLLFGKNNIPMTYEITGMSPPNELVLNGRGDTFEAVDKISFEPLPGGTRLTYGAEVMFEQPLGKIANILGLFFFQVNAKRAVKRLQTMLSGSKQAPRLDVWTRMADRAILPGLASFTSAGYYAAKRRMPVASSLYAGRTMVITGGTSGIGKAAVEELYARGAHTVVVGRNPGKLAQLKKALSAKKNGGCIDTEVADLSILSEIRNLADRLNRRYDKIDVLINNAGALFNDYQQTDEGIEKTLATDLLGPYLLTRLLLPALKASKDAAMINVSSGGMYTQRMDLNALDGSKASYNGLKAYAQAKRALVILTEIWAEEFAASGIKVHAMHPGWVDTPGLVGSLGGFRKRLSPLLKTPAQGADTIVWLAGSPDAAKASGRFWLDRKIRSTHVFPNTRESREDRRNLVKMLNNLSGIEPLS